MQNAIPAVIELEHLGVPFRERLKANALWGHTIQQGESMAKRACAAADRTGHAILHALSKLKTSGRILSSLLFLIL
jgi:succinate dehydrogenase / fumarate reductase flavoprotein subunit